MLTNGNGRLEEFAGMYAISEAARYIRATSRFPGQSQLNIRNPHLIRWIRRGLALPALAEVPGRDLLIAFEDLISMRVIALLRVIGVSFPRIHTAERWLREHTGARRPFATQVVWTESRNIFMDDAGMLIAASLGGQHAFPELVRRYLIPISGLYFNDRGIANAWSPHRDVLLKPTIQFGAPCLRGTRIPTHTIWDMRQGGDSVSFLANTYGLAPEQVERAIEWEERLVATQ